MCWIWSGTISRPKLLRAGTGARSMPVRRCRTPAMGGQIDRCDRCDKLHISYNSCRNRHCPTCQGHKREQWIRARESELLNVPYFHVVFTLPSELNIFALSHPKTVYGSLFKAAWATLGQFWCGPETSGRANGHDSHPA